MNTHRRVVHSGEKPFACKACPKTFSSQSNLGCHERIHSGERKYICDLCSQSFVQLGSLKKHSRAHKKGTLRLNKNKINVQKEDDIKTAR